MTDIATLREHANDRLHRYAATSEVDKALARALLASLEVVAAAEAFKKQQFKMLASYMRTGEVTVDAEELQEKLAAFRKLVGPNDALG